MPPESQLHTTFRFSEKSKKQNNDLPTQSGEWEGAREKAKGGKCCGGWRRGPRGAPSASGSRCGAGSHVPLPPWAHTAAPDPVVPPSWPGKAEASASLESSLSSARSDLTGRTWAGIDRSIGRPPRGRSFYIALFGARTGCSSMWNETTVTRVCTRGVLWVIT